MNIKFVKTFLSKALSSFLLLTVLTACGGGSDTSTPPAPPPQVNTAPTAIAAGFEVDEDTELSGQLMGSDSEGDSLNYQLVTEPINGSVTISSDGEFLYSPLENFNGDDTFEFRVSDGELNSGTAMIEIIVNAVNDVPVSENANFSIDEDTNLTEDFAISDPDDDTLEIDIVSSVTNGALVINDTSFIYTPAEDFFGDDSFEFQVFDGTANSETIVVTINVQSVNDAPVATTQQFTTTEDSSLSNNLLASDVENSPLTYSIAQQATFGIVEINPDGTFVYTPNSNYFGEDDFDFVVSDGELESSVTTVGIEITAVNDAPVANASSFAIAEDFVLTNNLVADDIDNDPLSFTVVQQALFGVVDVNQDGTFVYTPNPNFFGTDNFSFIVSDGVLDSLVAQVALEVTPVNDLPVVEELTFTVNEDEELIDQVIATDIDSSELNIGIMVPPENGIISQFNADGTFTYVPNENFNGTDVFSVAVDDGSPEFVEQSFNVEVNPVNDIPTITGTPIDNITAFEEYNFIPEVVEIDTDDTLTFSIVNLPVWAEFNTSTGELKGIPENTSIGNFNDILISVSDGIETVELPGFGIEVIGQPWLRIAELQTNIFSGLTSAALLGSKIYMLDLLTGDQGTRYSVFDLQTGIQTDASSPSQKGFYNQLLAVNSKVFVMGGRESFTNGAPSKNRVEEYLIDSDTWVARSPMNVSRSGHAACTHNGKAYVFGGNLNVGDSGLVDVEAYDPLLDAWTVLSPMPIANSFMSCTTAGDKIFLMGGTNNSSGYMMYDVPSDTWQSDGLLPFEIIGRIAAATIDGDIYLFGGDDPIALMAMDTAFKLNLTTFEWSQVSIMLEGRSSNAFVQTASKVYLINGYTLDVDTALGNSAYNIDEYTPSFDPRN